MRKLNNLFTAYERLGEDVMMVKAWDLFIKAVALAFLAYWFHLGQRLNDWLGSEGFHLHSPASKLFVPLPSPFPELLWWVVFTAALFLLFNRMVTWGSLIVGMGFFYATMCDMASIGALNMHFLFALAVIFWSTRLRIAVNGMMPAWPAYLIRIYLIVVYFGSGWRKVIFGNWLNKQDALLTCITGYFTTNFTRWMYFNTPHFIWTFLQYTTIAFELGAPLLLLYPPLRKFGVILGCSLHLGIAFLMRDLFYFSFQMLTFYIPFLIPTFYLAPASPKKGHQSAI